MIELVKEVRTRFVAPQLRPQTQIEPPTLDVRARVALYGALDRDALADANVELGREFGRLHSLSRALF